MRIKNIIKELNLPEKVLNTSFIPVPSSYKSEPIHGFRYCKIVSERDDLYERKHYSAFERVLREGSLSDVNFISVNDIVENPSKYCFNCIFNSALSVKNFDYNSFNDPLTSMQLLAFLADIEGFLNEEVLSGEVESYLREGERLFAKFENFKKVHFAEKVTSSYFEAFKMKVRSLDECYLISGEFKPSVSFINMITEELFSEFLTDESSPIFNVSVSNKDNFVKFLEADESFAVFDASNVSFSLLSTGSELSKHLLSVVINDSFKKKPFVVLPYVQYLFLKTFVLDNVREKDAYFTKTRPSEAVVEVAAGLLDKSNFTFDTYNKVFEAALIL